MSHPNLFQLLDLAPEGPDRYVSPAHCSGFERVFGGQVIGQSLAAASRTVAADRFAHSLHAYFLRSGDVNEPIVFEVERTRDGGSFSSRRVQALQRGEPILSLIASFQIPESGWQHQDAMPAVAPPESLLSGAELYRQWQQGSREVHSGLLPLQDLAQRSGIEVRPVVQHHAVSGPAWQHCWFRTVDPLPGDALLHRCVLAYASDFNLLGTAKLPHGGYFGQLDMIVASLDHAMWFHQQPQADDWLLYSMDSPAAGAARGFARGQVFNRRGELVASVAQEGLMRHLKRI